jgi:hypothetical protein
VVAEQFLGNLIVSGGWGVGKGWRRQLAFKSHGQFLLGYAFGAADLQHIQEAKFRATKKI